MDCHHYDAFRCRSCSLLEVPRARQLSDKEAHAQSVVDSPTWLPTVAGVESGFRNLSDSLPRTSADVEAWMGQHL